MSQEETQLEIIHHTITYTTDDFIEAFELYYMLQSYGGRVK